MGLEDLLPEDENVSESSSSRSGGQSSSSDSSPDVEYVKTIGTPPREKKFTQEQWDKVKRVIADHFDLTIGEVLSSPSEKRYKLIHEAIMFNEGEIEEDDISEPPDKVCYHCGNSCKGYSVEIEDEYFCNYHTAGEVIASLRGAEN